MHAGFFPHFLTLPCRCLIRARFPSLPLDLVSQTMYLTVLLGMLIIQFHLPHLHCSDPAIWNHAPSGDWVVNKSREYLASQTFTASYPILHSQACLGE